MEWPQYNLYKTHKIFKRIVLVESSPTWPKEIDTVQNKSRQKLDAVMGVLEGERILHVGGI